MRREGSYGAGGAPERVGGRDWGLVHGRVSVVFLFHLLVEGVLGEKWGGTNWAGMFRAAFDALYVCRDQFRYHLTVDEYSRSSS